MLPWSEASSGVAVSGESGLALKNSASAFFAGAEVSLSTAFWYSITASSHRPALKARRMLFQMGLRRRGEQRQGLQTRINRIVLHCRPRRPKLSGTAQI